MKEQINTELLKLEEELGALDTAVNEITKAGKISENIIENTKNIHEGYKKQLTTIQQLYSEYLNRTYHHTENNIQKIFNHFQEKIADEEKILEKYTELSIRTEDLTHEYLKNITDDNKKQITSLVQSAEKNVNEQKNIAKLHIDNFNQEVKKLLKSHNERLEEEEKLLASYLELAQSTAKLTDHIKTINFEKHFEAMNAKITANTKLQQDNNKLIYTLTQDESSEQILFTVRKIWKDRTIEEVLTKTNKTRKKLTFTNIMVFIIFLMNLIFYVFFGTVFFKFFPHFFEDFF